jgi:hypothetical protein
LYPALLATDLAAFCTFFTIFVADAMLVLVPLELLKGAVVPEKPPCRDGANMMIACNKRHCLSIWQMTI